MTKLKKAEMSIYGALIAFAVLILFTPIFSLFQVSKRIELTEYNMHSALVDTCLSDTIVRYNDVKYKTTMKHTINCTDYRDEILDSLNYVKNGSYWEGNSVKLSNVVLTYNEGSGAFVLKYDITTSFKVLNTEFKNVKYSKENSVQWKYRGNESS